MSSGYFPLRPSDDDHAELAQIAETLDRIASEYRDEAYALNPEDAMSDGQYINDLRNAADLVRGCLQSKFHPPCPECGGTGWKQEAPDDRS